ncbi:MAG: DUF1540 domain-containing protein [Chitinivibrionales bacterium]|nr:DUF1540 domain-containing protein [Chitinivibrionales bacterium]
MKREMPEVLDCEAENCVYNKDAQCHAMAITVGDDEPCCDTFASGGAKAGYSDTIGKVGACKVQSCIYNDSLECSAPQGIRMKLMSNHADCATYQSR